MTDESSEISEYSKLLKAKRILMVLDIVVLVAVVAAAIYFFTHKQDVIDVAKGACNVCMEKTGAICQMPIQIK